MRAVKLSEIAAGMVLAQALTDTQGRTLLKGGVALTDKHIERIRAWGFDEVPVVGENEVIEAFPIVGYPIFSRPWEEILAEIHYKFEKVENDSVMRELEKALITYLLEIKDRYGG